MQYIDFCCKKTTREHIVLRIKNSVIPCHPLTKKKKLPRFLNFFLFVAILWIKQVYLQKTYYYGKIQN